MIVDAHTDVLLELVVEDGGKPSYDLILRCGEAGVFERYWLPRLLAGDVGVQICPLYGEGARRRDARTRTLAQEAEFRRVVERHAENVCLVQRRTDLDDSRLRLVLSMEGVEPLEGDPDSAELHDTR
jgi:microsomal dipeptidase-like Zn-dependent dipeptidase